MLAIVPPISLGAVSISFTTYPYVHTRCDFVQVFYGRYLKRLSNKTQEALGDMTKVGQPNCVALCGWPDGLIYRSLRKR